MFLPLRLKTIGNLIDRDEKVADVGADHGLLELYLIGRNINVEILAIENKKGPHQILDRNVGALKAVRVSFSDGLACVGKDITTIVLAGLGGLTIKNILEERPEKLANVKKVIVDAHRDIPVVRKTLINYGFEISKEIIVYEEKKFYDIILFERSENHHFYTQDEIEFGYKVYEDKLWPKYRSCLINRNKRTICKIRGNEALQDKVLKLQNTNERLMKYGKN